MDKGLFPLPLQHPARSRPALTALALAPFLLLPTQANAGTFRVDVTGGLDGPTCGSEVAPCASLQKAVDLASDGDTILVAQGTYVDDELCATGAPPGLPTVLCVQKQVTILGGFDPATSGWSVPNPIANTTTIDGQSTRRGVIVNRPAGGLRMEGFTIQNCLADNGSNEFGGGMWAVLAGQGLTLRSVVFADNSAQGGSSNQAGGGGLAIQGDAATPMSANLEGVRFERNEAQGGSGGAALGGGLHIDHATVGGFDLEFVDNTATGGSAGDALGGGASFLFGSSSTLERIIATGNQALGTTSSSAFGGGIYAEGVPSIVADATSVTIIDADIQNNTAQGGSTGGAAGGGMMSFRADTALKSASVIGNFAVSTAASAGGGGVFFQATSVGPEQTFSIVNSVIAKNIAQGTQGGGGGLRLLGSTALVQHTTFAENQLTGTGLGNAILAGPLATESLPAVINLEYSIIADHAMPVAGALFLQVISGVSSTGTFTYNQFTGNALDRCDPIGPLCSDASNWTDWGTAGNNIHDGATASAYFVDPINSDFHIDGTAPPANGATGSLETLDLDSAARDANPDIGADEFGATAHRLTVRKVGAGTGTVTSVPAGISCGPSCTAFYPNSQVVDLTATPDSGSTFMGFAGDPDCTDGNVTILADVECDALLAPPTGQIIVEKQTIPDGRIETFSFQGAVAGSISDNQQLVLPDLAPGTYVVTELAEPGFNLTALVCDDGASATPSTIDLGSSTATFEVDHNETVTCTFTNTLTTCSAAENDIVLENETVTDSQTVQACNSITAGPYSVTSTGSVTFETLSVSLLDDFSIDGQLTILLNEP